jgi:hypothetical protein
MTLSPKNVIRIVSSTWSIIEPKRFFETCITRSDVNDVRLFHFSYFITIMAYLCSQWASNVQIKCFMIYWSIYRLFVLNRGWKLVCLKINIFVYFCSTWGIVELKTRFEAWITRKDVNGVCLFRLSYIITLMSFLCSQRKPHVQV